MYGTKKIVSAVLYFVPSVMFRSSLSPRIAALLILTLQVEDDVRYPWTSNVWSQWTTQWYAYRSKKASKYKMHRQGRMCQSTLACNLRAVVVVRGGRSKSVSELTWLSPLSEGCPL